MRAIFALVAIATCLSNPHASVAQDDEAHGGGRWVPRGTFAISNLEPNELREKSYARASEERARILTFLPGMTIVYQTTPSAIRSGYVNGITHSGIRVQVPQSELSTGQFIDRREKDVVVHFEHLGCREPACRSDGFPVASGQSFEMISDPKDDTIELFNRADEIRVFYPHDDFYANEIRGLLTLHKGRKYPRLHVYDGYAARLSTRCGEARSIGYKVEVPRSEYETAPSSWDLNSDNWSLKAIEVMDLGQVLLDEDGESYTGTLTYALKHLADPANTAIDLTIFAYRDSGWKAGYFKYAGISQVVKCEEWTFGSRKPTYAEIAAIYFDKRGGDDYEQKFPLQFFKLQNLYTDEERQDLFTYHNRSFFYSINSSGQYEQVFEKLSKSIQFPNAVANIISRLNASCREADRKQCEASSRID